MDPTRRFTRRVAEYVGFRPSYPVEILDTLAEHAGLNGDSVVADIGAGTGISAELLLRSGCTVLAVEPNEAMRGAAEERLASDPRFRAIAGTAEATSLPDATCDLVTSAQAFHWFDVPRARREFGRILKPAGKVALFWNIRLSDSTPFLAAYEQLVRDYGIGYTEVTALTGSRDRVQLLFPRGYRHFTYGNGQTFDFAGLKGRLLSSSYTPPSGHPSHAPMVEELRRIFDLHQEDGSVRFLYRTDLFLGEL